MNFKGQVTCRCGRPECNGGALCKRLIIAMGEYDELLPGYKKHVNSGYRCPWWNAHEGGSKGSRHTKGEAVDFSVEGLTARQAVEVAEMVEYFLNGGIGVYINGNRWFIHCDVRRGRARWFYRFNSKEGKYVKQSYKEMLEAQIFTL